MREQNRCVIDVNHRFRDDLAVPDILRKPFEEVQNILDVNPGFHEKRERAGERGHDHHTLDHAEERIMSTKLCNRQVLAISFGARMITKMKLNTRPNARTTCGKENSENAVPDLGLRRQAILTDLYIRPKVGTTSTMR